MPPPAVRVSDQPARTAPSPRVRRRRVVVLAVMAVVVACWCCSPCPSGRSAGAPWPRPPRPGQEYVVKAGDTLASIAARVDPAHAGRADAAGSADEVGSTVVVPGEHIFIP